MTKRQTDEQAGGQSGGQSAELTPKQARELVNDVEALKAWLRTKPAAQTYDYHDTSNCALCQFLAAHGAQDPLAGGWFVTLGNSDDLTIMLPEIVNLAAAEEPWTFSAMLDRLNKAQRDIRDAR